LNAYTYLPKILLRADRPLSESFSIKKKKKKKKNKKKKKKKFNQIINGVIQIEVSLVSIKSYGRTKFSTILLKNKIIIIIIIRY